MTTPSAIAKYIRSIEPLAQSDPEAFHSSKDALYSEVMEHIANGLLEDPKACAEVVVKVERIQARWSACA